MDLIVKKWDQMSACQIIKLMFEKLVWVSVGKVSVKLLLHKFLLTARISLLGRTSYNENNIFYAIVTKCFPGKCSLLDKTSFVSTFFQNLSLVK